MSQIQKWFERSFTFGYPKQLLPNLEARLRGTAARLEELTRTASLEALTHKPQGKWSAQEQAGHLLQLEPLWLTRAEDYVVGKHTLTATDLQNRATDEANFNAQKLNTILNRFRIARERLLERIPQLEETAFTHAILHPRMQVEMRLMDHLYFVAEHDDHHLAIIHQQLRQ